MKNTFKLSQKTVANKNVGFFAQFHHAVQSMKYASLDAIIGDHYSEINMQ